MLSTTLFALLVATWTIQFYLYLAGCKGLFSSQNILKNMLVINRVIALSLFFTWIAITYGFNIVINRGTTAMGVMFVVVGQVLNVVAYRALGVNGVYYGRIGELTSAFPYNVISHPMYVGCILTTIGLFLVVGIDSKGAVRGPVLYLSVYVIVIYVIAMFVERDACV